MNKIYCIGDEEELVADMPNIINERIKAELEEIKAELKKYAKHEVIAISIAEESGLNIAIDVLDKHIKEIDNES